MVGWSGFGGGRGGRARNSDRAKPAFAREEFMIPGTGTVHTSKQIRNASKNDPRNDDGLRKDTEGPEKGWAGGGGVVNPARGRKKKAETGKINCRC